MPAKKSIPAKSPASKRVSLRGRRKSLLARQVWFRLTEDEFEQLHAEAEEQGRLFSGHLRFLFLQGWKAVKQRE